jgi:hypothetical protein
VRAGVRENPPLHHALLPSPYPSPTGGFAQKVENESKIDIFILLKIQKLRPKPTFWAKLPQGEGTGGLLLGQLDP